MVNPRNPVQKALFQLLQQEIRNNLLPRFGIIVDPALGSDAKAAFAVKINVAFHADSTGSHLCGSGQGKIQQELAVAFALRIRVDTDRPKGHDRQYSAVIRPDLGTHKHHVSDQPPADLQTQVKLFNKFGPIPELMQHIMLGTARAVDVPKGLAGQVLHRAVIRGGFSANGVVIFHFLYLFQLLTVNCERRCGIVLQASRLPYNLQGVVTFQTAFSPLNIFRLTPVFSV